MARGQCYLGNRAGWLGVRGIGSLYYLMYAIQHGLETSHAVTLVSVILIAVTLSIVLHGITVTPLMRLYAKRNEDLTHR